MNTIRITTTQNIELEYDLASLGDRIVGRIIDMLIIAAYVIVFLVVMSAGAGTVFDRNPWLIMIFILPIAFYDLALEILLNGQSVGKRVMKIKVINIDGNQPSLGQYVIRWLFRLIDFTLTGGVCALITVAVSEKKQRVGDIVAGTTLIKTQPRTSFNQTLYVPTPEINYTVSYPAVTNLSDKDIQLIKEALLHISKTNNLYLAYPVAEKVKKMLNIETNLEPSHFLQTVVADYNYLTSRG
ncbi:MAG: RDD family protein [Bacteroidetes bacterium]|nr:RDD family protein [Bacteroidota bacterium]MBS1934495.1 RDD family protein [Bacteroidota bacterium]